MKFKKQISAIFLALAMVITLVPQTVFADTEAGFSGLRIIPSVPSYQCVPYGGSVTLGITVIKADCPEDQLTYTWYSAGSVEIEGAHESTYTVENVTEMNWIDVKVQDQDGHVAYDTWTIQPGGKLSVSAVGGRDKAVAYGGNVELKVNATVTDGSEDKLTYSWMDFSNSYAIGDDATTDSCTIENVTKKSDIYCTVRGKYGFEQNIVFTVHPDTGLEVKSVTSELMKVSVGDSVHLEVAATVTDGSEDKLTYSWSQYVFDPLTYRLEYDKQIAGATGSSYTAENITTGMLFQCNVTDQYGYTKSVLFYVFPDSGLDVKSLNESTDIIVPLGGSATLGVNASVTDGSEDKLNYNWNISYYDRNGDSLTSWSSSYGETGNYTIENLPGYVSVDCTVTDQYGYSKSVSYKLHPDSGLKVEEPSKEVSVAKNGTVTMSVNASVNEDSQINKYVWYTWDEDELPQKVATGNTYTVNKITEPISYWCKVYDQYGYFVTADFDINVDENAPASVTVSNGSGSGDSNSGSPAANASADGAAATTDTSASGKATETATETNSAGKSVTVTTTTNKDADGNVTSVTEQSVIEKAAKNTTATVTVEKNAEGKVTSAEAAVTQTAAADGKKNKVSLNASVISQIQEAAGQKDVDITLKAVDASGKTKYTVTVNAKDVKPGKSLYAYVLNTKTGEYTMVDSKTYTVSKKGTVSISKSKKANYALVNTSDAKKINKEILATASLTKTSKTVKAGKTANVTISKKLNTSNVKSITYTTSKKSIASVSKSGKVTAKSAGTATIKAKVTFKNGSVKTLKLKVTVK